LPAKAFSDKPCDPEKFGAMRTEDEWEKFKFLNRIVIDFDDPNVKQIVNFIADN
jgi:hypothetical protein